MVRRQIQLTDEQDTVVRREAVARGLSIAGVIRELVEESLRRHTTDQRTAAASVIGAYAGGDADVSTEHDAYLADAYRA